MTVFYSIASSLTPLILRLMLGVCLSTFESCSHTCFCSFFYYYYLVIFNVILPQSSLYSLIVFILLDLAYLKLLFTVVFKMYSLKISHMCII